jgi:hypothetical protein
MAHEDSRIDNDHTAPLAVDPERMRIAQERGAHYLFIPRHLAVDRRPELTSFPLNVLFVSYRVVNGIRETGEALYEPDLATFTMTGTVHSMTYRNAFGADGTLQVAFDVLAEQWHGQRFIAGERVDEVTAFEWRAFFLNLTALGLVPGEACRFTRD